MRQRHFVSESAASELGAFLQRLGEFSYYRPHLSAIEAGARGAAEVLDALPLMSGDDLVQLADSAYERLGSRVFLADRTTGTSGAPKIRIATPQDDRAEAELCLRFFKQCGVSRDDSVLALDIDSADIYLFYESVLRDVPIGTFTFFNSDGREDRILENLLADSDVLLSVPSLVSALVPLLAGMNARGSLKLRRLVFIGEPMPDWLRQAMSKLGIECFSFFGATEIGSLGGECQSHMGLHLPTDRVIPTLLSADSSHQGAVGEIVWTTLHFRDFPLVKYRTGDYGRIVQEQCACGLATPRLIELRRTSDHFSLFGHTFEHKAFETAMSAITGPPRFLQIELAGKHSRPAVTFWLPAEASEHERKLGEALRATDELGYFDDRGLVAIVTSFSDAPIGNRRKIQRVLDHREITVP